MRSSRVVVAVLIAACSGEKAAPTPPPLTPAAAEAPAPPPHVYKGNPELGPAPAAPTPPPPAAPVAPVAPPTVTATTPDAPPKVNAKDKERERREATEAMALQEEEARRYADMLFAEEDSGTSEGDMSRRTPGADLGTQIDDSRQVILGGGGRRGTRSGDDPRTGTRGPADTKSGGVDATTTVETPRGTVSVGTASVSGGIDAAAAGKAIAGRTAGMERCYATALGEDPALAGTIELELRVNEMGVVTGVDASGTTSALDGCIAAHFRSVRFPVPNDDLPATVSVRLTLAHD
jgi:hypothetical protein